MFLQSEFSSLSSAQQNIVSYLNSMQIPINKEPRSLLKQSSRDILSRIIVSSKENNIECRIALGRAPIGAKCVAPCGCTGSQKWVQFSELNKLRRKDPSQWKVCQTCQQKYDYEVFSKFGGVKSSIIGLLLDRKIYVRSIILVGALMIIQILQLHNFLIRFCVSKNLWMMYPQWSKLTHVPLALKFWIGKLMIQYIGEKYGQIERETVFNYLTDLETKLIEDELPVVDNA